MAWTSFLRSWPKAGHWIVAMSMHVGWRLPSSICHLLLLQFFLVIGSVVEWWTVSTLLAHSWELKLEQLMIIFAVVSCLWLMPIIRVIEISFKESLQLRVIMECWILPPDLANTLNQQATFQTDRCNPGIGKKFLLPKSKLPIPVSQGRPVSGRVTESKRTCDLLDHFLKPFAWNMNIADSYDFLVSFPIKAIHNEYLLVFIILFKHELMYCIKRSTAVVERPYSKRPVPNRSHEAVIDSLESVKLCKNVMVKLKLDFVDYVAIKS